MRVETTVTKCFQASCRYLCPPLHRQDVGGWWWYVSLPHRLQSDPRPCQQLRSLGPHRCHRYDYESSCGIENECIIRLISAEIVFILLTVNNGSSFNTTYSRIFDSAQKNTWPTQDTPTGHSALQKSCLKNHSACIATNSLFWRTHLWFLWTSM